MINRTKMAIENKLYGKWQHQQQPLQKLIDTRSRSILDIENSSIVDTRYNKQPLPLRSSEKREKSASKIFVDFLLLQLLTELIEKRVFETDKNDFYPDLWIRNYVCGCCPVIYPTCDDTLDILELELDGVAQNALNAILTMWFYVFNWRLCAQLLPLCGSGHWCACCCCWFCCCCYCCWNVLYLLHLFHLNLHT